VLAALKEMIGQTRGGGSSGFTNFTNLSTVIPYSSNTEIPNPQRGQYLDNLQYEPEGYWQGTSFTVNDYCNRYIWNEIEPTTHGTYVFTDIDDDIATAASNGCRFGFRIMFASPSSVTVPTWAQSTGATQDLDGLYFPIWNNATFLGYVQEMIAALGARYDLDERVAWFEVSGYGDWGELHVSDEYQSYGLTGPSAANSIADLGYYQQDNFDTNGGNQGVCQVITAANITQILQWNVAAFPNTRLVCVIQNVEFVRQILLGKNFSGTTLTGTVPTIPPGLRYDHLSSNAWGGPVFGPNSPWGSSDWYYLNTSTGGPGPDPVVAAQANNWQTGPWMTEFVGGEMAYALSATVRNQQSMTPSNLNNGYTLPLDSTDYQNFFDCVMYGGYRYSAAATLSGSTVTVTWTNWGVAPVYESWKIVYEVRNASNAVVQTVNSSFNLTTGLLAAAQSPSYTSGTPASASANDTFTLGSLPAGSYTIYVGVLWNHHKPSGVNVQNLAPMALAQTPSRDGNGYYEIASFTAAG
jgi:hypothetical protein